MKRRLPQWLFIGLPVILLAVFFTLQALSLQRLAQIQHNKQLQAPDNNSLWVITQAQMASHELRHRAFSYALQGGERSRLTNSHQVFLSRFQLMREGPQWRQVEGLGLQSVIQRLEPEMPQLQHILDTLEPGDFDKARQVEAWLQPLDQRLARAAVKAMVTQWDTLGEELEITRQQLRYTFILLLGILLVGTVLGASLVFSWRKAKEKAFTQHVVGSSIAGVITLDQHYRCTAFNPAAERLFKQKALGVLGRLLGEKIGFFAQRYVKQALESAMQGNTTLLQGELFCDGQIAEPTYLEVRVSTLRDDEEKVLGAIVVVQDVTEQHISRRELDLHRNHLEQLVRERTLELDAALQRERNTAELYQHFAAMVSHQFRTPLAIVDSSLQRLMRRAGQLTEAEVGARVQRAREAVARLTRLVDSTLGAARLEDGQIDTHPEICDVLQYAREACQHYPPQAGVISVTGSGPALAWCDPIHLEHILCNLIGNACKYATTDDGIEIVVQTREQEVVCTVSNPGSWPAGFEPDQLFELYWRGGNAIDQVGLGIGLYMARELARLQGGDLRVETGRPGWVAFVLVMPKYA